jgi:hypothetical protein
VRGGVLHHASNGRASKSLVVRGGLPRTFGGLVCFLAGIFLCWGIYTLEEAFAHPVDAQAAALIAAAFAIALAILLLFYLFKPRKKSKTADDSRFRDSAKVAKLPFVKRPAGSARRDDLRTDLAYQRLYVDHSHIRP